MKTSKAFGMFWWADLITFHLVPILLQSVKAEKQLGQAWSVKVVRNADHVQCVITEPWRGTLARPNCSLRHCSVVCAYYTA
jgi:hypothetical protein